MAINMKNFEKAMRAALKGPQVKNIKIEKHTFNIKPVKVTRKNGRIMVDATDDHQISHRLRWRKDDQIYYSFEKEGDLVKNLQVQFKPGGFGATIIPAVRVVGLVSNAIPIPAVGKALGVVGGSGVLDSLTRTSDLSSQKEYEIAMKKAFNETKELLDGSWKGEAKFLIANIALRIH